MTKSAFQPHGQFEYAVRGRVLHLRTRGPWNRELIEQYKADLAQKMAPLFGAPWGVLATVVEEGIHTPESLESMVEGIRAHRKLGRCGTAVVFERVYGESLVRNMLERMYRQAAEPVAFFHDSDEALIWLLARIEAVLP